MVPLAPFIPGEHTASASFPLNENVRERRGYGRVPISQRTVVGDSMGYNPGHTIQEKALPSAPLSLAQSGFREANWQNVSFPPGQKHSVFEI